MPKATSVLSFMNVLSCCSSCKGVNDARVSETCPICIRKLRTTLSRWLQASLQGYQYTVDPKHPDISARNAVNWNQKSLDLWNMVRFIGISRLVCD